MKIILAIDSFKGCLTSEEVETIFSQALSSRGMTVRSLPMSDGGEGMLEAFISALTEKLSKAASTRSSDAPHPCQLRHCTRRNSCHRNSQGMRSYADDSRRTKSTGSYNLWSGRTHCPCLTSRL